MKKVILNAFIFAKVPFEKRVLMGLVLKKALAEGEVYPSGLPDFFFCVKLMIVDYQSSMEKFA
uniref:Uncharacterized protein n=1 Tax=Romanomermis culicivorax TaxID=13658 RepID=A0A915JCQ4_ROMCU